MDHLVVLGLDQVFLGERRVPLLSQPGVVLLELLDPRLQSIAVSQLRVDDDHLLEREDHPVKWRAAHRFQRLTLGCGFEASEGKQSNT